MLVHCETSTHENWYQQWFLGWCNILVASPPATHGPARCHGSYLPPPPCEFMCSVACCSSRVSPHWATRPGVKSRTPRTTQVASKAPVHVDPQSTAACAARGAWLGRPHQEHAGGARVAAPGPKPGLSEAEAQALGRPGQSQKKKRRWRQWPRLVMDFETQLSFYFTAPLELSLSRA